MIARLAIAGLRLAALVRNRKQVPPADVSSIALIELTGLGDVISMLPAVRGFRMLFPSAVLHVVVDDNLVELLESLDLPAAIHGVVRSRSMSGTTAAVNLVTDLRPTLACSMSPPRRNALVALASGAPCMAGYLRYTDSLTPYLEETPVESFGLTTVEGFTYGWHHISDRALMVCRALGLGETPPERSVSIAPPIVTRVRSDLLLADLLPAGEFVVIHPFAGWRFRQWPESAFGTLAKSLLDTRGTAVVFMWEGEKDGDLQTLRRQFAGDRRVMFATERKLLECAVLISGASLFIGNDSGPLHLAAALGVPAVGLFGPSDPSVTAPRTLAAAAWLYKRVECSPCDQRSCIRPESPCMNMISADEVLAAAASVWRAHPAQERSTHA